MPHVAAQASTHAKPLSDLEVSKLIAQADLIVVATPQAEPGWYRGSGPYPNGVTPTPCYEEFCPEVKIDRVLKGEYKKVESSLISVTVLEYKSKDPPPVQTGKFSFDIGDQLEQDKDKIVFPKAPHENVSYVFFLQGMTRPDSQVHESIGKKVVIRYRTFDFEKGMITANVAFVAQVQRLLAAN